MYIRQSEREKTQRIQQSITNGEKVEEMKKEISQLKQRLKEEQTKSEELKKYSE